MSFVGQQIHKQTAFVASDVTLKNFSMPCVTKHLLASGQESGFKAGLWDRHHGVQVCQFGGKDVINAVAVHPIDESVAVTVSDDMQVVLWRSKAAHATERRRISSSSSSISSSKSWPKCPSFSRKVYVEVVFIQIMNKDNCLCIAKWLKISEKSRIFTLSKNDKRNCAKLISIGRVFAKKKVGNRDIFWQIFTTCDLCKEKNYEKMMPPHSALSRRRRAVALTEKWILRIFSV